MSRKLQSALEQYKARREGRQFQPRHIESRFDQDPQPQPRRTRQASSLAWRALRIAVMVVVLSAIGWHFLPQLPDPVNLTYEVDLSGASAGNLVITMIIEGDLPGDIELVFPPGIFGDAGNGVTPRAPTAHALHADGRPGLPLTVEQTGDGWRLSTRNVERAGFIYRVDLARTSNQEEDIRRHISTPINGGVRLAGFEVFLEPLGVPVNDLTVTVHNPAGLPVIVPWPALVRDADKVTVTETAPDADQAHLGGGQGFLPTAADPLASIDPDGDAWREARTAKASLTSNLLYHPSDMADLSNALLVAGNVRLSTARAQDCVIQYATDSQWNFRDQDVLDLVRRIARTEIAFFGTAPTPQITVLLGTNQIQTQDSFDVYGVHTGSSILVMLSPDITWGELEDQAASVIAHEMFHGWLGEAVGQTDPQTRWFTEGATTWFAARMLTAAGIWDLEHSQQMLYARLERDYARNPLLGTISVAEASIFEMADADRVRFSYAGAVAACMALDQWLGEQSGKTRPLDEVLRYLYDNHNGQDLSLEMLQASVLAVTGIDCALWLETYVYGKTALPPVDRLI